LEFQEYGASVLLFPGVKGWFDRMNAYAKSKGVKLLHYIISSGLKEMIEGTSIAPHFEQIYASCFMYDEKGEAVWPAVALNYTAKTQFLFRINKGCPDINDNETVNKSMPEEEKPVPFSHIVYIGDGDTDVPCMKMVKILGGHTVAVYQEKNRAAALKAKRLKKEKRADAAVPADYRAGMALDIFVRAIVDEVAASARVGRLMKKIN
ncbi:MAG: HAD family hydrolase, partial [Alphaproteobacteria bacterium]